MREQWSGSGWGGILRPTSCRPQGRPGAGQSTGTERQAPQVGSLVGTHRVEKARQRQRLDDALRGAGRDRALGPSTTPWGLYQMTGEISVFVRPPG